MQWKGLHPEIPLWTAMSGALRSRGQALLRASAVMSFWQPLGRCEVLQALTDTLPAID